MFPFFPVEKLACSEFVYFFRWFRHHGCQLLLLGFVNDLCKNVLVLIGIGDDAYNNFSTLPVVGALLLYVIFVANFLKTMLTSIQYQSALSPESRLMYDASVPVIEVVANCNVNRYFLFLA